MAYSLATSYAGDALINGFNWIDTRDLSNGYVRYQSQANAASQGLFAVDKHTGVVRIGVDHTNTLDVSDGRPSIRLESKEAYNQGLFVADFLHMPPSQCGVWPAFWAYGPNWPNSGEIDIIEGANTAHRNIISAHTTASCSLGDDVLRMASGAAQTKDCNVGADNVGCGYVTPTSDTSSYGDTFNAVGGGIYAMLWDDEYIKVWHFDRDTAPADIAAKKPEPASWGKPAAVYGGKSCDVESHFRDMSIVLNINFCGDYGNAVWKSDGCSALAPTCSEWVAKNPAAFANAYWDVNYIDAYVQSASNTSTTSSVSFSNFTSSTVSSQSQPSSIPITSLSSTPPSGSNNGTMTRFPAANSSSSSAPTSLVVSSSVPSVSGPSNSSSFITNISTRFSSSSPIVLATQGPIPTASLPSPSGPLRANPANLNDFSYLGCFGSSSDFKSFTKVADSPDMNLNKCTVLCNGKKYAGVFETACYCASELDADTRVSTDACDMPCPGDSTQLCGGRAKPRGNSIDGSIGAKANVTLPQTTAFISGVAMPISTGGGGGGAGGRLAGSGGSSSSGAYASGSYFNSTGPEAPNTFSSSAWNIVTDPKAAYGSSTPTSTIIGAATTRNKTTLQTLPTGSGSSASNPSVVVPSSVNFSPSGSPATDGHGAWINSTSPETPTPASISSQTGTAPVIRTSSRIGTAPVVSISSRSSAAPPIIGTAPPVIGTAPTVSVVTIPVYPLPKVTNSILSSSSRSSGSSSSSSSSTASSAAVSGSAPAPIGNSTLVIRRRYSPVRRSTPKHVRPAHVDRREASDMLLTVYAAIAQEEPPKQPPGMGANSDLSTQPSSTDTPAAQQSSGASIPAQQSSGAGIPAQQSSSAGAAAQQSISMGIPAQQSSGASIPAQQSSGAGIPAQQSSSAGTPTQQQSSGGSSPGQQSSSAGYPAPQSSGGSSPGQQAPGTGVTSIPNSPAQQSNGNAAAIQTPSTVTSTTTTVVTTVTYQTVYPSNPSKIVNKVFVTTIIKAHCGCPETPLPTMTVSMTTTVLSCAACGPGGANYVTVTVPCDESEATPTAAAELPPAPNSNGNVPPANKNLTPPNGDSVPPTSGGNKPPTPGSNKPPTSNGSVPPGSNGSVPPGPNGSNGSVPPGSNGSVPPGPNGSNGSVPPGPNGNVPPGPNGSNGSVPPGSNGSVPPGSNGSVPPGSNGSVPPAFNDSVPPTSGGNVPTSANNDKPSISNGNARPSADSDKPPASNGNKTPSANNDKPPASNGNAPPSADSDKPPASNGNKTPSANNDKPPASNGNVPPAPNSGKPPAANSNKTPSSSSSVPPAVSGNKPAAPSSNVPTVAGASGFKVTSLLFTTMLAMVVLL